MKNVLSILSGAILLLAILGCEELELREPGNLVPKTVMEDLSLPSITVNNIKLHSEAFGHPDSTMIVVIHGGPGSIFMGRHAGNRVCRLTYFNSL